MYFRNYGPRKTLLDQCLKSPIFKGSFGRHHGKRAETLLKFAWLHLYHIYWSLLRQLTCKKSLLVTWKISRLFPNTLSGDGKHFPFNRDNLRLTIQMQLYRKQKCFCNFFSAFLKYSLNFGHFLKNITLIADVFPKLRTRKNLVRSMPKKCPFMGSFKKQHGKCAQIVLKSQRQLLYDIYWSLLRQVSVSDMQNLKTVY